MNKPAQGGYAALMSALIIATLLTLLVFATSADAFLARFDTIDYETHLEARHLAVSCLFAASYALAIDHSYSLPAAGITVFIGSPEQSCHIDSLERSGITITIITSALVQNTPAHMAGSITIPSAIALPILTSWKELDTK